MTKRTKQDMAAEARLAAAEREAEAIAAEVARKAVAWQAAHPRATMEELEVALLQLRAEFSQELARVLLEHREAAQACARPALPAMRSRDALQGCQAPPSTQHAR